MEPMYTFRQVIGKFLSDDNINSVRASKNPKHKTVLVPWHELSFRERKFDGITHPTTLQNSWFNRPFNDKNTYILVDKARYAIQIIAEIADMGVIPVSYIYDFPSGLASPRLYLKDRGNTTHILSDPKNLRLNTRQWNQTIARLKERPSEYVDNIIANIEKKLSKSKNSSDVYSLNDMLSDEDRDRLKNMEVVVRVSIESLDNHKNEMEYINNTQNKWTPHTFGMLELVTNVVFDETSKLDVDEVYNYVSNCDVFLGNGTGRLFEGRRKTVAEYPSHEDEILWYWVGCRTKYKTDLKGRYSSFEDTETIDLRKEIYGLIASDRKLTTKQMISYAKFIQDVGSNPKWTQLITTIDDTCKRIEELRGKSSAGAGNVLDLSPKSPRAAMRWTDMIYDISNGTASDIDETHVITRVVNRAIEMLELGLKDEIEDNPVVSALTARKTSRGCREEYFYSILQNEMTKEFKNEELSGRTVKQAKLAKLQALLTEGGIEGRTVTVVDRVGTNEYTYTELDLVRGDKFQLGHKISRKNGGRSTADNTFLQFPQDNIHNSSDDISNGYWKEYKKWVVKMEKAQKNLPKEEKVHFTFTKKFCDILGDTLI